jgi:hypothetical protein
VSLSFVLYALYLFILNSRIQILNVNYFETESTIGYIPSVSE